MYSFKLIHEDNSVAINSMGIVKNGSLFYRSSTSQIDRYYFDFKDSVQKLLVGFLELILVGLTGK